MTLARRCGLLLGIFLWLGAGGSIAGSGDGPRTFKSGVDLVTVDVCVRDAGGRFLPTLSLEDFVVLENGTLQHVTFLAPGDQLPLRVVLLLDSSASMAGAKMKRAKEAAARFAAR